MITIEKNNMVLKVDFDGTKEYYEKRSPLTGVKIKNFEMQVEEAAPLLKEYLDEFGVDITKPDELCWCWKDGKNMFHYNVAYTVTGEIVRTAYHDTEESLGTIQNEIILQDKSKLHIVLETEYVPNKQTKPYFAFTIYNIEMPWILEEEYLEEREEENEKESFLDWLIKKLKKG